MVVLKQVLARVFPWIRSLQNISSRLAQTAELLPCLRFFFERRRQFSRAGHERTVYVTGAQERPWFWHLKRVQEQPDCFRGSASLKNALEAVKFPRKTVALLTDSHFSIWCSFLHSPWVVDFQHWAQKDVSPIFWRRQCLRCILWCISTWSKLLWNPLQVEASLMQLSI